MKMMTCQICSTDAKYFAKYIKLLVCLFINFANCNPFVAIPVCVTRHHFHSYSTNQKSLFFPSLNFSRCANGLFYESDVI